MTSTMGVDRITAADGKGPVEFPDGLITNSIDGEIDHLDFDLLSTAGNKVGRLRWNPVDRCLEFDSFTNGDTVTNQIGQETWVRVRNNTGAKMENGKAVYVTGATGNRPTIALAKADSESTTLCYIGLTTEEIEINADGFVTILGSVRGVNTNSFEAGDLIYVSADTAGGLTNTRPTPPNQVVSVGIVTVKSGNGEICVQARIQPNIERLSNVYVDSPADGDVLTWVSTHTRWENKAP